MSATTTAAAARAALREVDGTAASLDMFSTESDGLAEALTVGERRRRLRAGESDPVATVSLVVAQDEVLLWREGGSTVPASERRRYRGVGRGEEGELVELYQYEKLEPNQINDFLTKVDIKLNPRTGLRRVKANATWGGAPPAPDPNVLAPLKDKKRRLLLVHGTFSRSEALLHGIGQAPNGGDFFKRVFAHYDEVLVFDHPTLSVSPVLNAFDLFHQVADASGPLDVIAHSRGGLVTRWFLEGLGTGLSSSPCRAVLVGSPLGGTSLASPPRLRDSLSMLSNLGTVLKTGGAAAVVYMPLLAAPLALLRVASSVVSAAAKTPVIDAAVSMIPGLAAQSRVDLNHELARVRGFAPAKPPTYYVVRANFETEKAGWKFWKWFRGTSSRMRGPTRCFPGRTI